VAARLSAPFRPGRGPRKPLPPLFTRPGSLTRALERRRGGPLRACVAQVRLQAADSLERRLLQCRRVFCRYSTLVPADPDHDPGSEAGGHAGHQPCADRGEARPPVLLARVSFAPRQRPRLSRWMDERPLGHWLFATRPPRRLWLKSAPVAGPRFAAARRVAYQWRGITLVLEEQLANTGLAGSRRLSRTCDPRSTTPDRRAEGDHPKTIGPESPSLG